MLKSIEGTNPLKGVDVKAIQLGFQGVDQVQWFCRFDRGIVSRGLHRNYMVVGAMAMHRIISGSV